MEDIQGIETYLLGRYIKKKRRGLGLSQRALAEKSKLSLGYIRILEEGKSTSGKVPSPTVDTIHKVACALGEDLHRLVSLTLGITPCAEDENLLEQPKTIQELLERLAESNTDLKRDHQFILEKLDHLFYEVISLEGESPRRGGVRMEMDRIQEELNTINHYLSQNKVLQLQFSRPPFYLRGSVEDQAQMLGNILEFKISVLSMIKASLQETPPAPTMINNELLGINEIYGWLSHNANKGNKKVCEKIIKQYDQLLRLVREAVMALNKVREDGIGFTLDAVS